MINKFNNSDFEHSFDDAMDIILNTVNPPLYEIYNRNPHFYANQILERREGIHHFFVFDELNTMEMLLFVSKLKSVTIEYFVALKGKDTHFALRKS